MNDQEWDPNRQIERCSMTCEPSDPHLQIDSERDNLESAQQDETKFIFQKLGTAVGEILNQRDEKLKRQLFDEIYKTAEQMLGQSLEDRLTAQMEKLLDERSKQWQEETLEKILDSMLVPNNQFLKNLRPLVVQILAERFLRSVPMNYRDMIQLIAEEKVRSGMSSLLKPGSTFEKDAVPIVSSIAKECLKEELGALLNLAASEAASGPMERISATVDPDTADQMRALGGNFSEHVRNALNVYLKALEGQGGRSRL